MRVAGAAACYDPDPGERWQQTRSSGDPRHGEGRECRRAILRAQMVDCVLGECGTVERFRRGLLEEGVRDEARQHVAVNGARHGKLRVAVHRLAGVQQRPIVEKAVARPGIECDQPLGRPFRNEGHVRDAADIDESGRQGQPRAQGQGAVIDRNQRRALPAILHIGGAEIVDHRNAKLRA